MTDSEKDFQKFIHSPVGKKLVARKLVEDVDPQYLLENYLRIAFKAGRESMGPEEIKTPKSTIDPFDVIEAYRQVFKSKIVAVPQRLAIVRGRISDARKAKLDLKLEDFKKVFEFKKAESVGKQESWLEFETLCARKHFFKYLEQANAKPTAITSGPQPIVLHTKLF